MDVWEIYFKFSFREFNCFWRFVKVVFRVCLSGKFEVRRFYFECGFNWIFLVVIICIGGFYFWLFNERMLMFGFYCRLMKLDF